MSNTRSELQREVVEALVSSKAINFDAVGTVLSKFGARAAHTGDSLGVILGRRVIDLCIPVDFRDVVQGVNIDRVVGQQVKG